MNNQKELTFLKKINMHKDLVQFVKNQEIKYGSSAQTKSLLDRLSSWGVELKKITLLRYVTTNENYKKKNLMYLICFLKNF